MLQLQTWAHHTQRHFSSYSHKSQEVGIITIILSGERSHRKVKSKVTQAAKRWRRDLNPRCSHSWTYYSFSVSSPVWVIDVSSLLRALTSSSFSWWISSFSFSPWRKVVVWGLCLERHCGKGETKHKRVCWLLGCHSQRRRKDPAPWRVQDPWWTSNCHLMADSVTPRIKCLKDLMHA